MPAKSQMKNRLRYKIDFHKKKFNHQIQNIWRTYFDQYDKFIIKFKNFKLNIEHVHYNHHQSY